MKNRALKKLSGLRNQPLIHYSFRLALKLWSWLGKISREYVYEFADNIIFVLVKEYVFLVVFFYEKEKYNVM